MAAATKPRQPANLGPRGKRLWKGITDAIDLDAVQVEIATEACRMADRLDGLDEIIRGKGVLQLMHFRNVFELDTDDRRYVVMTVDSVLGEARQQENVFKQLLASLRMPDAESGKRPQRRGGARGAYDKPAALPDNVSPIERARRAAEGG